MAKAIPRAWIDNYVRTISNLTVKAQGDLRTALMAADISDRAAVAAIMREHCKVSTEAAAKLAQQFYSVMSLYQTTEDVDLAADSGFDPDAIDDATYAIFERCQGDASKVLSELLTRVGYEVNRSSKHAIWSLGRRDGRVVTYARVPQGSETCAWCLALAGKGFHYMSRESAEHTHSNCDCAIVPSIGKKGVSIDGYDPDAIADQWRDAQGRDRPQELIDRIAAAKADHERRLEQGLATNPWTSFNEQLIVMRYFNPQLR